jgi:hypothetical protein
MDALWYARYRRDGGTDPFGAWETSAGLEKWEQASAPGQVGRKVLDAALHGPPPEQWARTTTNVVHWATGIAWGAQFGAAVAVLPRHRTLFAIALGPVAWLTSYLVLPLIKVYKPIWEYDAPTLAKDLSAHVVFGATAGTVFRTLNSPER